MAPVPEINLGLDLFGRAISDSVDRCSLQPRDQTIIGSS
jgi:hypothetical protein